MILFTTIIITFIVMLWLGYLFHWMFHQSWSGKFYKAHLTHHDKAYPPESFTSNKYRDAGIDNTTYLFLIVFSPIIIGLVLLIVYHVLPIYLGATILLEMILIGVLNDKIHESFHLNKSIWHKLPNFQRLKYLHLVHHCDVSKNFGVFNFWCDKVCRTFEDLKSQ